MSKKWLLCSILGVFLTFVIIVLLLIIGVRKSKDCRQFVIDSYEVASGIDIPKQVDSKCFFFEDTKTRLAIYQIHNTSEFIEKYKSKKDQRSNLVVLWSDLKNSEISNEVVLLSSEDIRYSGLNKNNQWQCFLNQDSGNLIFEIMWL